jgi:hypothetical protein
LERFDPKVTLKVLGEVRHGTPGGRPDVRLLGGWFVFDSPDTALLVSLLPSLVHVRGVERFSVLVRVVGEEASERWAGRDLVLTPLVEVLLIEADRFVQEIIDGSSTATIVIRSSSGERNCMAQETVGLGIVTSRSSEPRLHPTFWGGEWRKR